uniref:DNA polymerase sliding clamp n=1 Tax=Nanoarchaeum equitans (strain Kin4-M) TaxID=228908 RepID=PCNA_NANEQ|nr:RecName: Full=DNA polymerase sliding clamp; AltName: Full=Proliferating cell nuclear antigen homolog; Short=PCNA [Nanoarchaeum equitans Kin4-M]
MRVTFPDAKALKKIVPIVADLISEGQFVATEEGIKLVAMDPASIAMVIWEMKPEAFIDYTIEGDKEIITVSMDDLKTIVKKLKQREMVVWETDREKNKLKILARGTIKKTFSIPLLEGEETETPIPSLEYNNVVELDSKAIKEIIDDASAIADSLKFKAEPPSKLIIKAEGEMKEMTVELTEGEDAVVSIDIQEEAYASYSIDYLKKFAKAADVSDIAILKLKTDYPLWLEYRYLDKMTLIFILAPRSD